MAEPISSRELVRAIGAEFDGRDWSDDKDLALQIATAAARTGALDSSEGARLADDAFLAINRTSRGGVEAALDAVFSGRALVEVDAHTTTIDNSVTIGNNNTISGPINTGGSQLVITNNTPLQELLAAISDFVASAITNDDYSPAELELLDCVLAARDDLEPAQIVTAARTGIEQADPELGRLAQFRDAVLTSAASGLAVQAIVAAAGALL